MLKKINLEGKPCSSKVEISQAENGLIEIYEGNTDVIRMTVACPDIDVISLREEFSNYMAPEKHHTECV